MAQFYDQMAALNVLANVGQDDIATGSITTQNTNGSTGVGTAGSYVQLSGLNGVSVVCIQVTGTYTGALTVQGTLDGTNWVTFGFLMSIAGSYVATIASANTGIWFVQTSGLPTVRVTGLAAMTGAAVVTMEASSGSFFPEKVGIIGNAGAATLDGAINSTAPANVLWTSAAPTTVTQNATTMFFNGAPTVANVKASAGNVYGFSVHNPAAATTFLQFYNTAGTPTLGTSVIWSVGVPAGQTVTQPVGPVSIWQASTGIGIGASTTATSTGTPGTAPVVTIFYR
jgi:hypothetical protein